MSNVLLSIVPTGSLAPLGVSSSSGAVMTKYGPGIYLLVDLRLNFRVWAVKFIGLEFEYL